MFLPSKEFLFVSKHPWKSREINNREEFRITLKPKKLKTKIKSQRMSSIEEQNKGRKEGEIRYLTPLNISTTTKKNIVDLKDQV